MLIVFIKILLPFEKSIYKVTLCFFIMSNNDEYKLDRTVFQMYRKSENRNNFLYRQSQSPEERLRAANYLNSVAYNYPFHDPPKLDRTYFRMRSRKNR